MLNSLLGKTFSDRTIMAVSSEVFLSIKFPLSIYTFSFNFDGGWDISKLLKNKRKFNQIQIQNNQNFKISWWLFMMFIYKYEEQSIWNYIHQITTSEDISIFIKITSTIELLLINLLSNPK